MKRVYNEKQTLDYLKVEGFFSRRSQRIDETGPLSVTMYQTEEAARRRDEHEKAVVLPLIHVDPQTRVLDIACGTGRWGQALFPVVASYLGIDFSEVYVEAGRRAVREAGLDADRFAFQKLEATALAAGKLLHSGPFDLVIIAGLTAFLNDDDVERLFAKVADLLAPGGVLYFREPLGVSQRLTLIEYPSEQLQDQYNAIYRTEAEIIKALDGAFLSRGAVLEVNMPLFPENLQSSETSGETEQRIFVLRQAGREF